MATTTSAILSTLTSASAEATATGDRAPSQGGVIEGANPSEYNPKDPIVLFIIQVRPLPRSLSTPARKLKHKSRPA